MIDKMDPSIRPMSSVESYTSSATLYLLQAERPDHLRLRGNLRRGLAESGKAELASIAIPHDRVTATARQTALDKLAASAQR